MNRRQQIDDVAVVVEALQQAESILREFVESDTDWVKYSKAMRQAEAWLTQFGDNKERDNARS